MKSGNSQDVINNAAKQNRERNELLGRWHGDILGPDWTYERVVALPMVDSLGQPPVPLCGNCKPYVLDGSSLENRKNLKDWLAGQPGQSVHPVDHQYKNLLVRNQLNSHINSPELFRKMVLTVHTVLYCSSNYIPVFPVQ